MVDVIATIQAVADIMNTAAIPGYPQVEDVRIPTRVGAEVVVVFLHYILNILLLMVRNMV